MFRKIRRYLKDPYYSFGYDMFKKCPHLMPDKYYLSVLWKMEMGYELDWKHPKTFNEKLQWLKLYDRKPGYTLMVDKYRVKQWVADKIGEQYVIPTLGVYDSVDEIELDKLPDRFVLKCNHDSGSIAICKDKSLFDLDTAKRKLGAAMKNNFYWEAREWPYKKVDRVVFAEEYVEDASMIDECSLSDNVMNDFDAPKKIIQVSFDRFSWHKKSLYGTAWNYIESRIIAPINESVNKLGLLNEMLAEVKRIGTCFPIVKTECFFIERRIYFCEITLCQERGCDEFDPQSLGFEIDDWVKVDNIKRFDVGWVNATKGFVLYLHSKSRIPEFIGLKDYKFFCFGGEPKIFYIANDRSEFPTMDFFDMNYQKLPLYTKDPPAFVSPKRPEKFEEMKQLAAILSEGIPQVRVDFYESRGNILFGEMTFFHAGGFSEVHPKEWNLKMGDWIKLPTD